MLLAIYHRRVGLSLCSAWLLSACSGGGNSNPTPSMYLVGGTLSGLASGASVVLQNSGGNNTTVSANGSFTFSTQVANGAAYALTVLTQPTGQTCDVTSGSGTISGANVTSAQIACTTNTYTISGTVSGLNSGAPVTMLNEAGDPTTVKANGSFSFSTPIPYNGSYAVTVATQPPAQVCTVTAGTGSNVTSNVSGVSVACGPATESVMHTFDANPDGVGPRANITQGSDGNFYGTTYNGGTSNLGTVFKITQAGVETVLHSFAGGATDGSFPEAALIQGSDGNFYGTTVNGGPNGNGTVFKITPSGVETVLYAFTGADGGSPLGALVQGSDGNFYGTTSGGRPNFMGTVFKLTPAGVMTILHSFTGGATDGRSSAAALVQGSDGNFYGTTQFGGTSECGTVFMVTPAGVETVLHFFASLVDGCSSNAAVIQGSDGDFYGTTSIDGPRGYGTVFKITSAGVTTVLHSFAGVTDGTGSYAALIQGSDGNFYGTTETGGAKGNGIVFRVTPSGVETVLYSFTGGTTDGSYPDAAVIQGSDGNFYGTTPSGGPSNSGTFIKITPGGIEGVVYAFSSDSEGQNPSGLIQGGDGSFYGTTNQGGTNGAGTVFKITPGGVETLLYSFAGGTTDGSNPSAALVQGSDGTFYGTTRYGGASNIGTVFKVTAAGVETVLHSFAGPTDGSYPAAALIQGNDGNFYGTTATGGASGNGTVFKITSAGIETVLYSFTGASTDGSAPSAALIQGSDGNFYGTTANGGPSIAGTVFKITPAGVETQLYSFTGGTSDGGTPNSALIQGSDGNFYGTTTYGGTADSGTAFKITPTGVETVLYSFTGGTGDGSGGFSSLIQGSDGNFYGTSVRGGIAGQGTLFKITPAGVETVLYSFTGGSDGSNPNSFIIGIDGIFYGTTAGGGSSSYGTVFKF
jgi:uncharacterized repeat protein (TIGR03803 family)